MKIKLIQNNKLREQTLDQESGVCTSWLEKGRCSLMDTLYSIVHHLPIVGEQQIHDIALALFNIEHLVTDILYSLAHHT